MLQKGNTYLLACLVLLYHARKLKLLLGSKMTYAHLIRYPTGIGFRFARRVERHNAELPRAFSQGLNDRTYREILNGS